MADDEKTSEGAQKQLLDSAQERKLLHELIGVATIANQAIVAMKDVTKALQAQIGDLESVKQMFDAPGLKAALAGINKDLIFHAQTITRAISLSGELASEIRKEHIYPMQSVIEAISECKKKKGELDGEITHARAAYNNAVSAIDALAKQAA